MRDRPSAVDQLVHAVTRDILLGRLPPSGSLPPLRALAAEHGITVPTAQRAVARLEELGLLEIRHGSGMKVRDPRRHANLAALPYWLEALRREPTAARALLADFLDLRAVLAVELLDRVGPKLATPAAAPLEPAIVALEDAAKTSAPLPVVVAADLEIVRRLLELSPQTAFSLLWSSLAALLEAVPEVARALYREPAANALGWRTAFALAQSGAERRTELLSMIRQLDQLTCDRFVEELSA